MARKHKDLVTQEQIDEAWRDSLMTGDFEHLRRVRKLHLLLPGEPRCAHCAAPFDGPGGFIVRVIKGIEPSRMNPRYCNDCELFAKNYPGGAEVDLAMVFVDVRGSTTAAEGMEPREFTRLIDRFHRHATRALIHSDALVEKLVGDQLTGIYVPGFAGSEYPRKALEAAVKLQEHATREALEGTGLPVGVGVHVGRAYVGAVGSREGIIEITALGDDVNTAARLCQIAGPGELVVSDAVYQASGLDVPATEPRVVELKGKRTHVAVRRVRLTT